MKPDLKLVPIYRTNFRDVPGTLRHIATAIENGEYGDVGEATLVTLGKELEIHGLGYCDGTSTVTLLAAAQHKMLKDILGLTA